MVASVGRIVERYLKVAGIKMRWAPIGTLGPIFPLPSSQVEEICTTHNSASVETLLNDCELMMK